MCGALTNNSERSRLLERQRVGNILEEHHARRTNFAHDLEVILLHVYMLVCGRVIRCDDIEVHYAGASGA